MLRRGNGRPTRAWERLLVFAQALPYYYDTEGTREPNTGRPLTAGAGISPPGYAPKRKAETGGKRENVFTVHRDYNPAGHALRDWRQWPTKGAGIQELHYASYPPALPAMAITAGTPERVCAACGSPHARVVERDKLGERGKEHERYAPLSGTGGHGTTGFDGNGMRYDADYRVATTTRGWRPTCSCGAAWAPARVLDPFFGSGSTGIAADRLGRDCTGVDLKAEYVSMAQRRVTADAPLFADVQLEQEAAG